jgi:hypothetical protein
MKKPTFYRLAIPTLNSVKLINQVVFLLRGTSIKFRAVVRYICDVLGFHSSKKKTLLNYLLFTAVFFMSINAFAQLAVPFTPRLDVGSIKVKGDLVFIGNSLVTGAGLPQPYNGNGINNNNEGVYINVESRDDPTIFSSSSAELITDNSCKKIVYAGLY